MSTPSGPAWPWLTVILAMNGLALVLAVWRLRQIGNGRADPVISSDWTSLECPASPAAIRWGLQDRPDMEDDHVGRPFPACAEPYPMGDLSRHQRPRDTAP